ncbi:hypothetical protein [Flexivirga endophytica]|uniref:hypothetical protein n=1 Tax=Flexivirga endophytica TaxID=1849103 RepID=UPI0016643419|nr:hypothetical protein [Flexivirga endophytica]
MSNQVPCVEPSADRRMRRAFVALEIVLGALVVATAVTAWSWWLVLWSPALAGLGLIGHLLIVDGCTLDRHGSPVTGRDADRYSRYRMKLTPEQRDALDDLIEQHRFNERES